VLLRIRLAPNIFRSAGRIAFTVAAVPTGAKTGVSMAPCGVWNRPARALLWGSVARSSNSNIAFSLAAASLANGRARRGIEVMVRINGGLLRCGYQGRIASVDAAPLGRQQGRDCLHHRFAQGIQRSPSGPAARRLGEGTKGRADACRHRCPLPLPQRWEEVDKAVEAERQDASAGVHGEIGRAGTCWV
jgi:hypothetical protein